MTGSARLGLLICTAVMVTSQAPARCAEEAPVSRPAGQTGDLPGAQVALPLAADCSVAIGEALLAIATQLKVSTVAVMDVQMGGVTLTRLVGELSAVYRKERPHGHVAALGWAGYYAGTEEWRGSLAADWLAWAQAGTVEELWLYRDGPSQVSGVSPGTVVANATALVRRTGRWPVRGVLYMGGMQTMEALAQAVEQMARETDGGLVLAADKSEHLKWIAGTPVGSAHPR